MLPYWILFTACAAGAIQHRAGTARPVQGGPVFIAICAAILLMIGLRHQVGGDWGNYLRIFERFQYEKFGHALTTTDPGYTVLNWVAHKLGVGIWFVNLFCAVIFTWGLAKFVRRQPNPWLALVVAVPYLIIVVAMGYTRQAVAIGFILAGLASLPERQSMLRFAFLILCAAAFHRSAIIVLPLAAFSATRNRVGMIGLAFILGLMLYQLFVRSTVDTLMQNYEVQDYDSEGAALRVTMNVVPALLFALAPARFGFGPFERSLWRNFSFAAFGALALLMLLQSSTAVDRMALYLIPLQIVILARLPIAFGKEGRADPGVTLAVIAYSALIMFVWLNYAANAWYWVPYRFYPLA